MDARSQAAASPFVWLGEPEAAVPEEVGPKAAGLARLRAAGLPVSDGFCLAADAYRAQLAAAGLADAAARAGRAGDPEAGRLALRVRLGLGRAPLPADAEDALRTAYRRLAPAGDRLVAVRSSALVEGTAGASFAGQLETFLGVATEVELATAVRACWASLWSPRALRYLAAHGLDPGRTAVAVLVQRLVPARAAGGALSRTSDGRIVLTAAWGLGPAVAQGEVVPDRYVLRRDGPALERVEPGRKDRRLTCSAAVGPRWETVAAQRATVPCLDEAETLELAGLVLRAEAVLGAPVELEWARDPDGFTLLQARPLEPAFRPTPGRPEVGTEALTGQPGGVGRATGRACLVRSEVDLARVRWGDVLVTRVPGPALAVVLPRVVAVVAERGGSTSHLAALARERGIPAVLGVRDATRHLRDGAAVTVDGDAGVVYPAGDVM